MYLFTVAGCYNNRISVYQQENKTNSTKFVPVSLSANQKIFDTPDLSSEVKTNELYFNSIFELKIIIFWLKQTEALFQI